MQAGCYRKISVNLSSLIFQAALVFLIVMSVSGFGQSQGVIEFVRVFVTDNSTIRSTTPAGIGYHPPSGNLYISDSEINAEGNWNCENIFEVPPLGNTLVNSYDAYAQGGSPCPDNSHREPTGIDYLNGFFYITDDDEHAIMKHDGNFGAPLLQVQTGGYNDAEGVTADRVSGRLYVLIAKVSGVGSSPRILVFDGNLNYYPGQSFSIPSLTSDPEGIAFHEGSGHLFLVSTPTKLVYEVDLSGTVLKQYSISGFSPAPQSPQGLTFAPSSDPNDDPGILHLYIVDGAGRVYEANIPGLFNPSPDITAIPAGVVLRMVELSVTNTRTNSITPWLCPNPLTLITIKDHAISYHYSATLFLESLTQTQQKTYPGDFSGFAPVFAENGDNGRIPETHRAVFDTTRRDWDVRSVTPDGLRLKSLPYSEEELDTIVKMMKKKHKRSVGFLHQQATEENFKSLAKEYRYVHVATHGFVVDKVPNLSGIVFSQSTVLPSAEDGILYSPEAYNLDLNADLVVLSSCESGVGTLIRGEGLMALTRGFLYAGAKNIIFSLWKVPDKHTCLLMVDLYKHILQGKNYPAALREAKLKMIANPATAAPQSWASFLLIGS